MTPITAVADALTAILNGHAFAVPFTALRLFQPLHDLANLADVKVSVVPKSVARERADRNTYWRDHAIDVAVQRKLGPSPDAEISALLALVGEIDAFLAGGSLDVAGQFTAWTGSINEPIYDPKHMAELGVFTGLLTLTYRIREEEL